MGRWIGVLFVCAGCAFGADAVTVDGVVRAARAAIEKGEADGPLAKTLHKWKASERVEDVVLEELESEGVGPKAMAELERMRDESRPLAPPAVAALFPHDPIPSIAEQRRVFMAAHENALNYGKSLPDFICTEMVRRYDDRRGFMRAQDTLEVRLSYFDAREHYRLIRINGTMTTRGLEEVGGAVTEGEFGSLLKTIFVADSKTVLRWDHWTTLRKRAAHVYTFRIAPENATYRMDFRAGPRDMMRTAIAGQHGFVYIDRETNQILRVIAYADIPVSFPVKESATVLDYDFTGVGGRQFLLPLRADVRMATRELHTRNLVEFQDYRKFTGESTITFQ